MRFKLSGIAAAGAVVLLASTLAAGTRAPDHIVLGASLFRAAWAYKNDRAWLDDQLALLSSHGFTAIRALGAVGKPDEPDFWDGREVDWRWPDYDAVITGLTDHAFDRYGIQVQWTVFGGAPFPDSGDRERLLDRFLAMSRGREGKILAFEIANEYPFNGFEGDAGREELKRLARKMSAATDVPVAASAHDPELCGLYEAAAVDMAMFHFNRTRPDPPWKLLSESGCKTLAPILSNNEPIGPGSSIRSESDPSRLVTGAANSFLSGMQIYIFHSGPGVRDDPNHPERLRPSKLQDLPASELIFRGFEALTNYLPADVHTWTRHPREDPAHPFAIEGSVESALAASRGANFVVVLSGARGPLALTARRAASVEVLAPTTGAILKRQIVKQGERISLQGLPAYVLVDF
jgi:hypothetical protein